MAETSDRVSKLATHYVRYSLKQLSDDAESDPSGLLADIRSLAGSVMRQDETKGLRRLLKRVISRGSSSA